MTLAWTLIAAAAVAPIVSRRLAGDPASPVAIVFTAWAGTLGLFLMRLVPYAPLAPRTWTIILLSIGVLIGTLLIGTAIVPAFARPDMHHDVLRDARRWIPVYAALGLAGSVWYVRNVVQILGWSALADGARIRVALGDYTIPSGFLFLQFFTIATPILAVTIRLLGQRLGAVNIAAASVCAMLTWLSTDRTEFFTLVLMSLFVLLALRGTAMSLGRLVGLAWIGVGGLALNFLAIARWLHKSPEASAYVYATASYPALDHALSEPPVGSRGLHAFYPIARFLERVHAIEGPLPSPILPYVPVTRGMAGGEWLFNGCTFLAYPYQDWGLAGVYLYVGVVGLVGGILYGVLRRNRRRPVVLLLFAAFATGLVLSPFVNKFNNTASWYIAIAVILPFLAVRRRRAAA